MSTNRTRSESLEEINTLITTTDHDDDDDDDDEDDESYTDDSYSCSTGESESESDDGTEEEFDEDDVSHLVPVEKDRSRSPTKRTVQQQEQQRRIVELAASSGSSDADGGYTTGSYDGTTTDGERGYCTQEGTTMTTGYGASSSYSLATQSTATTMPTSPSRKRPELVVSNRNEDDNNSAMVESTLTTPDINNRSSHRHATPRTGNFFSSSTGNMEKAPQPPPLSPRRPSHDRIPGGAAAKLMLLGPKDSKESEESSLRGDIEQKSSTESLKVNLDDLLAAELKRSKEEFSRGSPERQKRSQRTVNATDEDVASEATTNVSTTPSFLNRSEIFHLTASAAVAALLKPQASPNTSAAETSFSPSPDTSPRPLAKSLESSQKPNLSPEANPDVSATLLSKETEHKLEKMESKMLNPTKTLTDLLTAIASPDDDTPDPLGYAIRRKNACGALQTLTANARNRERICWTAGVLPALTSVLSDGLVKEGESQKSPYDDARIRSEYEAARNRAISALMNLSMPVKNRIAVFHSPGLVHTVLRTVDQDDASPRRGCCAVLAFLAKSSENRLLLAQVPGAMDVMRKVLKPRPVRVVHETPKEKKIYPWSDDAESSSSESSPHKGKPDLSIEPTNSAVDSGAAPVVDDADAPLESSGYDGSADEFLQGSRQNVFAMLGHLVKEKDNAYHFARDIPLLTTMVEISRCQESPSHALAIRFLAHLTRHRLNKVLAFKPKTVVMVLVEATQSINDDARLFACYALQNLSQEKSCRQELAIAAHLIEVLCDRCRNGVHVEERLAAISTLKNLCDEPANLIPMTNTTGCVSTLMHFAHAATTDDPPVTEMMQYRACDALATLSHWLRKIATSGHSLDASQKGQPPQKGLFVPSLREVSWNQWT